MKQVFSSIPGQVLDFILVLIGLVIIFKNQLTSLVNSIFGKITSQAGSI
ncbi:MULTISPECIES: Flp1 family type IVb pilin [Lachnospiraceae]